MWQSMCLASPMWVPWDHIPKGQRPSFRCLCGFILWVYYCILLKKGEPFAWPHADEITRVIYAKTYASEHARSSPFTEEMRQKYDIDFAVHSTTQPEIYTNPSPSKIGHLFQRKWQPTSPIRLYCAVFEHRDSLALRVSSSIMQWSVVWYR